MSKYLALSLMIVMFVVGVVGGYAFSAQTGTNTGAMETSKLDAMTDPKTAYSDQAYLEEMIVHHEAAIEMSKRVLEHTSRKEVSTMATNIIQAQSEEIATMKQWLEEWK